MFTLIIVHKRHQHLSLPVKRKYFYMCIRKYLAMIYELIITNYYTLYSVHTHIYLYSCV